MQSLHQTRVKMTPFPDRHQQCAMNGIGHRIGIVRIDDYRAVHLLCCACKLRQDQHARVIGILKCNIHLRHQAHARHQWGHQRNTGSAIDSRLLFPTVSMRQTVHRVPVHHAVHAVKLAAQGF